LKVAKTDILDFFFEIKILLYYLIFNYFRKLKNSSFFVRLDVERTHINQKIEKNGMSSIGYLSQFFKTALPGEARAPPQKKNSKKILKNINHKNHK
jgi:hypothetical protein